MAELPVDFVQWMSRQLPETELQAFLHSYEEPYLRGIRMNLLKTTALRPDGVLEPIPWQKEAFYLSQDSDAGAVPLHECGAYYIQEPSAMLPVAALDPQPNEMILDLCAAPGGKTTQIAAAMQGSGLLVSNEPVPKRAQILARNVERMGIVNTVVVSAMPDKLSRQWPQGFDAVLVDAPCSGEGMFRRHPETREEWTLQQRDGCAVRQAEILDCAAQMVRPGGRLVFSTCTLNTVENEDNVAAFCERHPDFEPESFEVDGCRAEQGMYTCYPHLMKGEGQFVVRLRRAGNAAANFVQDRSLPAPDKTRLKVLREFSPNAPEATHMLGETMVSMPLCPELKGIKVLRVGLHLGTVKGKLFLPDHAWALAMNKPDFPCVELTEKQAYLYQAGQVIELNTNLKGYVLPTYGGLALGWGKISDGVMKNHYPKGLRRPINS